MKHRRFQPVWFESFLAVAEAGSFSEAASRLHSSQSRISTHIAQLEVAAGHALIDRSRRPVGLTDAGRVMATHAKRVLRVLDEASDAFDDLTGTLRGTVTLGTHPSISASYMPAFLSRMRDEAPEVVIELTEKTTTQLVELLQVGEVDLAVRALTTEPDRSAVVSLPLWQERFMAVFSERDAPRTAPGVPVTPQELAGRNLIVIARPGVPVDPEFAAAFSRWGVPPAISGRTEEPLTLLNMVRAGLGTGVLNELALAAFPDDGIVARPIAGATEGRVVALCWDASRYLTKAARLIAGAILTQPAPSDTIALGSVQDSMAGPPVDVAALMAAAAGGH